MSDRANIGELVDKLAKENIELWHVEDEAVSEDDHQVANAKRRITELNKRRNTLIEQIDECIINTLKG